MTNEPFRRMGASDLPTLGAERALNEATSIVQAARIVDAIVSDPADAILREHAQDGADAAAVSKRLVDTLRDLSPLVKPALRAGRIEPDAAADLSEALRVVTLTALWLELTCSIEQRKRGGPLLAFQDLPEPPSLEWDSYAEVARYVAEAIGTIREALNR